MAPKQKKPSIIQALLKRFPLNIGTFIFGLLFIYMVISVILYLTADHIESYMVTAGPLAQNQTYTALVLRDETLVSSNASGYITYYAKANTRVAKSGVVYTLGENPSEAAVETLTEDDYSRIRSSLSSFSSNYSNSNFQETYNYKYELEGTILQYSGLTNTSGNTSSSTVNGQTIYTSDTDGIIVYSTDGYEDLDLKNLSMDWFDKKNYKVTNLQDSKKISVGDQVYKLITSEQWSVIIPLTSEQTVQLSGRSKIRVKFLKDDATQTGTFSIITDEAGNFYAKITFSNGMIRYSTDRFLSIELVTNTKSGLKIPLSAIVKKDFYIIPKEYVTYDDENGKAGFNVITDTSESGETTAEFVRATIYQEDEENYYVDTSTFSSGDVIIKPNSQSTYTIEKTAALEGVYCINKGYAVFRKISIIEQNDEYCIVEVGTDYGIAQFDYIVRDGSTVHEDDILYN